MQNDAPIPIKLPVVRPPSMEKRPPFVEVALASYPHLQLRQSDWLAQEEPLEISLEYTKGGERNRKAVSITMRTPGEDLELAVGFLISEGLINSRIEVVDHHIGANKVLIRLAAGHQIDITRLERHFYTSSSCGVCGKASLEAISMVRTEPLARAGFVTAPENILFWPDSLRGSQTIFDRTGGLHAAGLFDSEGRMELIREDVGRHNAVDKVIGAACMADRLPLSHSALFLSGRASFELVQKAVMAGIPMIASVGAPSSLAVELAKKYDMTLIGFVRNDRFNVYHGAWRLSPPAPLSD